MLSHLVTCLMLMFFGGQISSLMCDSRWWTEFFPVKLKWLGIVNLSNVSLLVSDLFPFHMLCVVISLSCVESRMSCDLDCLVEFG